MNQPYRIINTLLVLFVLLFGAPSSAGAVPPFPSSFYGSLKLNNANVADGTLVQAVINGSVVAFTKSLTYQGDSVYALDIPGDDPATSAIEGGKEGDPIQFKIGGIPAAQSGVWHSAVNVKLDLAAASSNTPLPPQPTSTPLPTQTPIVVQPTAIPPSRTAPPATQPPAAPSATLRAVTATQLAVAATAALTVAPAASTQPAAPSAGAPVETKAVQPSPRTPLNASATSVAVTTASAAAPAGLATEWIVIIFVVIILVIAIALLFLRKKQA